MEHQFILPSSRCGKITYNNILVMGVLGTESVG